MAWTVARGEMGSSNAEFGFSPSKDEEDQGMMEVEYDCAADKYFRAGRVEVVSGFMSGVFSSANVGRKVESDWNMVYVARGEGNCDKGEVTWKFRMREGWVVKKVKLLVGSCYLAAVQ
jgi:hypothetical protein